MPPKRTGLGPLGRSAVERAAATFHHPPTISESPPSNPSSITVSGFREKDAAEDPDAAGFDWYVFDSSRVTEAAYDPKTDRVFVRWQDGGKGYVYEGVPQNEWRNFKRSQSPGKFVNRVLNTHDYHRGDF
jgi:hypothetical protein